MSYEQLLDLAVNAILGANPKGSDVVTTLQKRCGSEAPQAVLDEYGVLIDSVQHSSQLAMSVADIASMPLILTRWLSSERGRVRFFVKA